MNQYILSNFWNSLTSKVWRLQIHTNSLDIKPRFITESITLRGPPCFLQAIGPECDPKLAVASILITGWLGRWDGFGLLVPGSCGILSDCRILWHWWTEQGGFKVQRTMFQWLMFSVSWSAEMYWCLFGQQPLECLPSLPCVAHGMSCSAPCGTSPTVKGHPRMDDVFDDTSQNNHLQHFNNKSSPQPLKHHWHSITFLVGGNMLSQVFPLGSWCGYGMLCTFHRHCRADLLGGPKKTECFFLTMSGSLGVICLISTQKNH